MKTATLLLATLAVCSAKTVVKPEKDSFRTKPDSANVIGSRPNIIWIMADDLGYNDIGIRDPRVVTPNMNELASTGLLFNSHYMAPQCSPSRSALLSGREAYKSRMQHGVLTDDTPCCLGLEYELLPSYLKTLGYHTHMVGKWHLGYCRDECTPPRRGFDTFAGTFSGEGTYYTHMTAAAAYDWQTGMSYDFSKSGVHSQDIIQERTLEILDTHNSSTPLFLYLAFHNPHSPMQPKPEFLRLYDDLEDTSDLRKKHLGLVSGMDAVIGHVMKKLQERNLYDNTLIIVSSDNGGDVGEGNNHPYRGGKGSVWEGGSRVLSFIHSPLLSVSGVHSEGMIHVTDWFPTLAIIAGGTWPDIDGLDGVDQSDLVLNNGPSSRTSLILNMDRDYHIGGPIAGEIGARNGRYKLVWGMPGQHDGYGLESDFIYNIEHYQHVVWNYTQLNLTSTSPITGHYIGQEPRGGPYNHTEEGLYIMHTYMEIVAINEEQFDSGTGHMLLFDLQEDPSETNNLIESTDPEHIAAREELVQLVQTEYNNHYLGGTPECSEHSDLSDPELTEGALSPGWCVGLYPHGAEPSGRN